MRLAFLTPDSDFATEWRWAYDVEAAALTAAGATVDPVPWTQADSLAGYDLILPLAAWGYYLRFEEWLAFLERLDRDRLPIVNSVPVLRWNGDKAYLTELSGKGISTVPTIVAEILDEAALGEASDFFGSAELVVKPPVSASAYGTFRLRPRQTLPDAVRGKRMIIQPWLERILDQGEYSLIFFGGAFSHCVCKVPRPGEFRVQPEYGGITARCAPPDGAEALAKAALAAAPAETDYARVDIVVGNNGELQLIELELIDPALFLAEAPEGSAPFAHSILAAAERLAQQPLA